MHEDPREKRRLAANWREYLRDTLQGFQVYGWAWREFVTPEAIKWGRRGLLLLLLSTVFGMMEPLAIKWAIDALETDAWRLLVWSVVAYGVFKLIHHVLHIAFAHCREWSVSLLETRLDARATELFLDKSLGQHMRDSDELSASNIEKGRNRVMQMVFSLVFWFAGTAMEVGLAFAFLWVLFPEVGAIMTLLVAQFVVWSIFLNRRVIVECTPIDAEMRRINRFRVERWDNVERVKTCGKEREETERLYQDSSKVWARDRLFWQWFIKMIGLRGTIHVGLALLCIAYGVWRISEGDWTVGQLVPLVTWTQHIVGKLWQFSEMEQQLNMYLPSVLSLRRALTMESDVRDVPGAIELPANQPVQVRFDNVSFGYIDNANGATREMQVLRDIGLTIGAGEKVAVLGDSGAGKTTLMRLVQRFSDPTSGAIRVNDHDLRDISLQSWTRLVGYIPQEAQVLDGTIRYNLLYGLSEAERDLVSDDELWRVMRLLKIDFGERLTDGLSTVVGRRGIKLSGGQAQRLMVGSAVLKRPRFMVIDEATSSLDSTTERAVQNGLRQLLGSDVSALIVTHRLSTVRDLCDKFVVLRPIENTPVGESQVEAIAGSFEELRQVSPTFRRLAQDQGITVQSA